MRQEYADANERREELNAMPQAERDAMNTARARSGEKPHAWPLKPLDVPTWDDRFLSSPRITLAERVCRLTRAELKTLEAQFAAARATLDGTDEFAEIQEMLSMWQHGEESRIRFAWLDHAKEIADTTRKPFVKEDYELRGVLKLAEDDAGKLASAAHSEATAWAKMNRGKKKKKRGKMPSVPPLEKLKKDYFEKCRYGAVLYEYARESPRMRHLAAMEATKNEWTTRWGDMHQNSFCAGEDADDARRLEAKIGVWAAFLFALADELAHDRRYVEVSQDRRINAIHRRGLCYHLPVGAVEVATISDCATERIDKESRKKILLIDSQKLRVTSREVLFQERQQAEFKSMGIDKLAVFLQEHDAAWGRLAATLEKKHEARHSAKGKSVSRRLEKSYLAEREKVQAEHRASYIAEIEKYRRLYPCGDDEKYRPDEFQVLTDVRTFRQFSGRQRGGRAIRKGSEVVALKINWSTATKTEMVEAFERLLESSSLPRPTEIKKPARITNEFQTIKGMLNWLGAWRMKQQMGREIAIVKMLGSDADDGDFDKLVAKARKWFRLWFPFVEGAV